ncbi:MAG: glycogen/starch synthase [Actinomycetota bacterium]|nr:glycogen/starch synthase [Actinomycetota bacterium]
MRILFASAEFAPFVRTGGLGNAVAGLAHALSTGHDVTVAVPGYRDARAPGRKVTGKPWKRYRDGRVDVSFWLDESFDRPGVYGPDASSSYDDNWERFARFSVAVAGIAAGFDVVHLHDGHVGAVALKTMVPTVFTIHNASYPMAGPLGPAVETLGLGPKASVLGGDIEWFGEANYLKAGIVGATQATTVSPGHARELAVDETSFGLGGIIRGLFRPIVGVLNGIDTVDWDPSTDDLLPASFDANDLDGREASRAALLNEYGLDDGFVLGNVGRMSGQKGLGLIDYDLDALIDEGARFVFMGNGDLDPLVDGWAESYPRAITHVPFDEPAARIVFAGSDAYLMPSQYEPCGLGQIYAMRYGAPAVAHFTGGLEDTVFDIDEDPVNGTGFVFRSFDHPSLTKTIRRAMRYHTAMPELWQTAQTNGMTRDWSWDARAVEYETIYESVVVT